MCIILQFFAHTVHSLFVDDEDVKVMNNLENKSFIFNTLDDLSANTFAELVPLLNQRKFL
jgi:hypothetical protein